MQTVKLTEAQKAQRDAMDAAWVQTLIAMARDDSDPESRDNARLLLDNRGVRY